MYQQKKQWCVLHAKLFKLFVGGALLLAVSPAYAAGDNYSGTGSTHSSLIVHQNGRTITGTVIDETGETVIGANVVVKGTTNGSITDVDGRFSLNNVPDGAILIVSYVGYEDLSVKVGVQSQLTIKLKESSELIDEVVVVGYASQKKVNLSGSVASVNMDDIAEKRPITNLSSGLAGMAAGVSVTSSSNKPGDDNASILVRGQGTLNNSSPLVIIDGVESNINTVAPQDVESMTVLKDAASASIYGSRAANGVILITTKKGKSGKVNIDYTGYASLESIGRTLEPVSNYADYIELMNEEDTTTLYAVSELEERLNIALAKLPENVRHTFEMNRFDGKTYPVIAEECGISVKTVEAHISRALKLLRSELKDFLPLLLLFLEP